jgi:hypothetical protein
MVRSCARWANHYYYTRDPNALGQTVQAALITIGVSPDKAKSIYKGIHDDYQEIETIASVLAEDT